MERVSLKSRAVAFAFSCGAVAFILSILALRDPAPTPAQLSSAIVVALIGGVMTWASAERCLSGLAAAIDATASRIAEAAAGDLTSATPIALHQELPELARALDSMFEQVNATLYNAQTLAMFDPVTSLANRTHFRGEAERILRASGAGTTALAFIDLDHFKAVNDSHGHARGDQMLAKVAKRLATVAAEANPRHGGGGNALVGRLSGDEFTLLFPHVDGVDAAIALGEAVLAAMSQPFDLDGEAVTIGASIGLALHPDHALSLTALMRAADVAMYRAKESGRGRVRMFDQAMAARISDRRKLGDELRHAVANEDFDFVYQPRMAMADGRVTVAEAGLRWRHPSGELRPLATFLDAAEDCGLIAEIGNWAVHRLAERLAAWPADRLAPRLSVVISKRQAIQPGYFDRVRAAVAANGASLSSLEFRIAEAVTTTCGPRVTEALCALRRDGALIMIDAFGAGESNLSRLRALQVDRIKLDRKLTAGIERDLESRSVVQATIALVHALGATAIAEGVDTTGQLDLLRVMGCDEVKGDVVAPAMIDADYRAWNAEARIRA